MKHLSLKKRLLAGAVLLFCTGALFAQNDALNRKKYWKFRTDFREKFIKIGPLPGESLAAGTLKPLDCVDNADTAQDGTPPSTSGYGEMQWGDGMIRHGHYLGLLATEYRLLKNGGHDVTGVLNELYYALAAINRLDERAEVEQGVCNGVTLEPSLNGFFMREDVGENFARDNWIGDPTHMGCTNSVFYYNNSYLPNEPGAQVKFNSYQNTPSLDQVSSLMVGFRLIHELLDDVFVKPTASDAGFYIVTETKAIVHRIVSYAANHNWFLIDVNGWPVNNGGGDLIIMAYPISVAATAITGNFYNLSMSRRLHPYKKIQQCLTGFGINAELTEEERMDICSEINISGQFIINNHFPAGGLPGPFNNQLISEFQIWQLGGPFSGEGFNQASALAWNNLIPSGGAVADDYMEAVGAGYEFLENLNFADYTETIMFNVGVTASLWNPGQVVLWGDKTKNYQLELIDAVLRDYTPMRPQSFYRSMMDDMTFAGPYQMEGKNWDPDVNNIYAQYKFHPNGWASEYRWTHPEESVGNHDGKNGMYSALDYMLFNNLYMLKFNAGLDASEDSFSYCNCNDSSVTADPPAGANSFQLAATARLNEKLAFLPNCSENVFAPVSNSVSASYDVKPHFSSYISYGIFPVKYQTENAAVTASGDLNVKTRFVICNGKQLTISTGGRMDIENSETVIRSNARIICRGEIRVKAGATLVIGPEGRLSLRSGSKLILEDGAKLVIDGLLEYYNGAQIIRHGTQTEIRHRGTIKTMNPAATFSITSVGATDELSGKFIIDGVNAAFAAAHPAKFILEGSYMFDPYLDIEENCSLNITDPKITSFTVNNCSVTLGHLSKINAEQPFFSEDVFYMSGKKNLGISITDVNKFVGCRFSHVPVKADLSIENTSKFFATGCEFSDQVYVSFQHSNDADALLEVTAMGYELKNCDFVGNKSYCVRSADMTMPSKISNCSFTKWGMLDDASPVIGIHDTSEAEIRSSNSTFTKLHAGIDKSYGKLSLKCNTFSDSNFTNISVHNCLLNMSIDDMAGYNRLEKSSQDNSITLSSSTLNLKNGYNFIEQGEYTITGTVNCPPSLLCPLNLSNNQWNTANTVPPLTAFQITTYPDNYDVIPLVGTVALKPACGYFDPPEIPVEHDPNSTSGRLAGGINDGEDVLQAFIYPNPVSTLLTLSIPAKTARASVKFMDSTGRILLENERLQAGDNSIDVRSFPTGIYFYTLSLDGKMQSGKIIKQ